MLGRTSGGNETCESRVMAKLWQDERRNFAEFGLSSSGPELIVGRSVVLLLVNSAENGISSVELEPLALIEYRVERLSLIHI